MPESRNIFIYFLSYRKRTLRTVNEIVDALEDEESDYEEIDDSDLDKDYVAESSSDDEDFPMSSRTTKCSAKDADACGDNYNMDAGDDIDKVQPVAGPSTKVVQSRDCDVFKVPRVAGKVCIYMDPPEEQEDAVTDIDVGKEGCLKKIWQRMILINLIFYRLKKLYFYK